LLLLARLEVKCGSFSQTFATGGMKDERMCIGDRDRVSHVFSFSTREKHLFSLGECAFSLLAFDEMRWKEKGLGEQRRQW
jgi:hypothetical protein